MLPQDQLGVSRSGRGGAEQRVERVPDLVHEGLRGAWRKLRAGVADGHNLPTRNPSLPVF